MTILSLLSLLTWYSLEISFKKSYLIIMSRSKITFGLSIYNLINSVINLVGAQCAECVRLCQWVAHQWRNNK